MFGIYKKLLVIYLLILAVVIAMISTLVFQFFKADLFDKNQNALLDAGQYINTLLVQYQRGDIEERDLVHSINATGHLTNSRIILIEGKEYLQDREYVKNRIELHDEVLFTSLEEIYYGNTITRQRQFSEGLDSYVIAVGMPAMVGDEVVGAIILFAPVGKLDITLEKIIDMIIWTAMASFAIGFVLIFFVSKGISKPIIALSKSTQAIAAGKEVEDLPVLSKDEIGQLVNSFNEMKGQLQQTETMRKELIAGVSHELRAPLAAIRGFIQAILDGVIEGKDQEKYLKMTLNETERLTKITNELLDLAKLEAGNMPITKRIVNIQRVIEQAAMLLEERAKEKNIDMIIEFEREILIEADGDRLKQVVFNLLENAITYTSEGGKIEVKAQEKVKTVQITIKDTGIGIPTEDIPYVFDKFYRVEKSRNQSHGGIGLGLAIVKNIVNLHGGTVSIESQLGVGTTIHVDLPKTVE